MLTDLQPMNALGDLAVLARRLDPWTKVAMSQGDAVLVAARGINNLPRRDGTVGVDPVTTPATVGGGQVGGSPRSRLLASLVRILASGTQLGRMLSPGIVSTPPVHPIFKSRPCSKTTIHK